jgi:hypothetical protein
MDKKYLQQNILSASYDRNTWTDVLKECFGVKRLHQNPTPILLSANDITDCAVELGSFDTADDRLVGIYEVKVKPNVWIEKNKVGLRNLLKQIYKYDVDGALIVFDQGDKWRFSYVSEINIVNESTNEIEKKVTEPKRYTYLFGNGESCRTAAERFYKIKDKPVFLDDLYDAFSVEKLNEDFFKSYKEYFEKGVSYLASNDGYYKLLIDNKQTDEDKRQKPIRDFVKKLLGRIVFLHFLQKKGWLGCSPQSKLWVDGDTQFMQTLFNNFPDQSVFHSKCLVTLFFETLNNNRKAQNDLAPKTLWGKNEKGFRIPYLNGGLFDKDISFDNPIDFPVSYFENLLDFFEQYNFTIDENDPYDSEVGIDPEMLGHIFENLLEENRERGAFYTPKEIVHYMCQEGIIEYLSTHLINPNSQISVDDINIFIRNNRIPDTFINHEIANNINSLLKSIKICDPAIGSGAFPMGMLKEIFECRKLIYPYLRTNDDFKPADVKKDIIQNNIYGVDLEAGAVDIARLRFWLALVVDENNPHPLPNLDYKIMQGNSLLESFEGIDLSHVAKPNMKLFEPQRDLFGNIIESQLKMTFTQSETVDEIQKLLHDFFKLEDPLLKQENRSRINEFVHNHIQFNIELRLQQLARLLSELEEITSKTPKQTNKIEELQQQVNQLYKSQEKLYELEKTNSKPFFLWHIYFSDVFKDSNLNISNGFDVVIGNPPYIQLQKMGIEADALLLSNYETFTRTGDIYCLFYELGNNLLKEGGNLIYITGSSWLRSNFGKSLRSYFKDNTNPLKLIDLSDCDIFQSATVLTTIFQFKKESKPTNLKAIRLTRKTQSHVKELNQYFSKHYIEIKNLSDTTWSITDKEKIDIKEIVKNQGKPLKNWDIEISYGVKTGFNAAFIIDENRKELLIKEDPKSTDIIAPILRGKDVIKYRCSWQGYYVLLIKFGMHSSMHNYPSVLKWLKSNENSLRLRGQCNSTRDSKKDETVPIGDGGQHHWLELDNNPSKEYFDKFINPKILYPAMVKDIGFTYDESGFFVNDKCFILTGEKLKYLVGILNSRLFRYCFEEDFPELQGNSREIKAFVMREIPILYPDEAIEKPITSLVDFILYLNNIENPAIISHTPNIKIASIIEDILNMVVYEIYFENELKNNKLNVLEFLNPVLIGSNANEKAILEFYLWYQQPENPVRNHILSVDIKSPDLLSRINLATR